MHLRPIVLQEDKTIEMFASADCQQLLGLYEDYFPKIGFNMPWVGYVVIRQNQIVGSCGFIGQPADGIVEIAYWTFREFERQGIASFACKELVSIANQTDPGLTINAKTEPEHNASTKILNNHFVFTEIVQDHEIGDAWLSTYKNTG